MPKTIVRTKNPYQNPPNHLIRLMKATFLHESAQGSAHPKLLHVNRFAPTVEDDFPHKLHKSCTIAKKLH
jgi:hypothetical protein